MKKLFSIPRDTLANTLIALTTGVGGTLALCSALSLTVSAQFVVMVCAVAALTLTALDCVRVLRLVFWPLFFAVVGLFAFQNADRLPAFSNALVLSLNGQPLALAAFSRFAALIMCLTFTALASALARSDAAFFPLALLCVAILLTVSFLGASISPDSLLPLLLALLLSARERSVSSLRILPLALLILCGVLLLMPMAGQKNDALDAFAKKARQAIGDYLFFTDARTAFSLSTTGWQPYGPEQLGGPVSPTDEPVMQVYTSGRTLLRGTVKNTYTGHAWNDTTDQRRYLFVNPRFSSLRRDLFDQMRPRQEIRDSVLVTEPMVVSMRAPSASTLYITQRFTSPAGEEIVAYFSPSTELFATRSLEAGNRYTFTGSRLSGASEGARRAVLASQNESDPYLSAVRERYLALPAGIDEQVTFLAQQVTQRAENDFDRAAALCAFLQRNYPYTLAQSPPPQNRDFVSWFLFEEQQGYCTSFATALAVMGRAVGLPTRYIEGYAAQPDENGVARVTQEDAHAWTEIYFSGFGWLPFDATPGTGFTPDGMDGQDDGSDDTPPEENDAPPESGDSDSSASPTPTAEPTASPTPTAVPTPTASPTPEHDDPSVTPTPEITPAPTPKPTPEPTPRPSDPPKPPKEDEDPPRTGLLPLLLLLLLATLAALRLYMTSPSRVVIRLRKANDRLLVWYRVCEEALLCLGIPPQSGEAPASYLERAQEALGPSPVLSHLGAAVCVARYSPHKVAHAQVTRAEKTYRALLRKMKPLQLLRMYARRVLRGVKL